MTWSVSILPKADQDLKELSKDPATRKSIEDAILAEFNGLKGVRVTKLFVQGTSTGSIDKLAAASFPGSIRLQVFADYRAAVLCLPAFSQAYVTHIFHKSHDPNYKRAAAVHDARAAEFIGTFQDFMSKRKR